MSATDIFIKSKKNLFEDINNVININFSESMKQGGAYSDNIINISFSTEKEKEKAGSSDTTEYFNRLAKKITDKVGGFKVNTNDDSSDIFLSSETINEIQNGGAKKNKPLSFNFDKLKTHLKTVLDANDSDELSGGSETSDEDDEDDELLLDDDSDEDNIFKSEDKTDDEINKLFDYESDKETEKMAKKVIKVDTIKPQQTSVQSRTKKQARTSKQPSSESSSITLSELKNSDYKLSDSIDSPQLMAYRKVNKNVVVGRRYL